MKGYELGKPFWQANIWIKNGKGDPLALEEFTTKREAINYIKAYRKQYKVQDELDCYISHFDEDEYVDYSEDI